MQRIFVLVLLLGILNPVKAGLIFEWDNVEYDITTFQGTFAEYIATNEYELNPWFNDFELARNLAQIVQDSGVFGTLPFPDFGVDVSPLFLYQATAQNWGAMQSASHGFSGPVTEQNRFIWAQVDPGVSVPEPSTLAIFSLGMMGLASRRFKKRP